MIITRTPFRISFAGGGSDLEACYSRQAGAVLPHAQHLYPAFTNAAISSLRIPYADAVMPTSHSHSFFGLPPAGQ